MHTLADEHAFDGVKIAPSLACYSRVSAQVFVRTTTSVVRSEVQPCRLEQPFYDIVPGSASRSCCQHRERHGALSTRGGREGLYAVTVHRGSLSRAHVFGKDGDEGGDLQPQNSSRMEMRHQRYVYLYRPVAWRTGYASPCQPDHRRRPSGEWCCRPTWSTARCPASKPPP